MEKRSCCKFKKKKFYEEYLNKLKNIEYEKEMKIIQKDIEKNKEKFVRINILIIKFLLFLQ